jgi:hypothetical protein
MKYPTAHSSPLDAVIGSHRLFGRTPLDALCAFCDTHHWRSQTVLTPDGETLSWTVRPIPARAWERYPVRVSPLVVEEVWVDSAHTIAAHPGEYRITVGPL